MASLSIKSNISVVSANIIRKLQQLEDREYLLRPVAFDVLSLMTDRIHGQGLGSDGLPIGTYSSGYLRLRQKKFKRSSDPKIIVSLTRQLENDWSVIPTATGYGIGFLNPHNKQKAIWVEEIKDRKIFQLSENEKQYAINKFRELIKDAINS